MRLPRRPCPWDIGQPQPAIVRLASEGGFTGAVLDAGCGTGENALHVASLGLSVLGVDVAETALAIARAKADDRGIEVEFAAADAFELERLGRRFETVLDCGLFHTFDGEERPRYVASLASVTEHDGTLYVLCFSDDGPDIGPHPISQEELRAAFNPSTGWNVAAIEPDRLGRDTTARAPRPGWGRSNGSDCRTGRPEPPAGRGAGGGGSAPLGDSVGGADRLVDGSMSNDQTASDGASSNRRLLAMLFVDLVRSTDAAASMGDAGWVSVLGAFRAPRRRRSSAMRVG